MSSEYVDASTGEVVRLGLVEMTNDEYHAAPGTSSSHVKAAMERSLLHFWHDYVNPEREQRQEKQEFVLGSAIHCAILEPDEFAARHVESPAFDRRSSKGRAMADEFAAEHKGRVILTPDEYGACLAIRDRVHGHPVARAFVTGGKSEQSYFALDREHGELVKCRPDYLLDNGWAMVDVKSTKNAAPDAFAKDVANYHYDIAVPWYLDVLDTLYSETPKHYVWLAVEKEAPYAIGLYFAEPTDIERARIKARHHFARIVQARRSNEWPDYASEVLPLVMPGWARR